MLNNALLTTISSLSFAAAEEDRSQWGRLVESAVGAHLINQTLGTSIEVFYWREGAREVDFVVRRGAQVLAIEVKSGRAKGTFPGLEMFAKTFRPTRTLLVGGSGVPVEEFLTTLLLDYLIA